MKAFIALILLLAIPLSRATDLKTQYPVRGQGEYRWFFIYVYDAKLWGPKEIKGDIYTSPLGLGLTYKRNFKGEEIVKQSRKEMLKAGMDEGTFDAMKDQLLKIFPDVKDGDEVFASFDPSAGITFYFNSTKELGKISDLNFSKKFLDIWLGDKTSAPELRTQLLGSN